MTDKKLQFKHVDNLPVKITDWVGSTSSIVVHTMFFVGAFVLRYFGFATNDILLFVTTIVSLEAIYLAIFIQMTVNRNTQSLEEVEEDIEEITEDIDKMEVDIDKLEEEEAKDDVHDAATMSTLTQIQVDLRKLLEDIDKLKQQKTS